VSHTSVPKAEILVGIYITHSRDAVAHDQRNCRMQNNIIKNLHTTYNQHNELGTKKNPTKDCTLGYQ